MAGNSKDWRLVIRGLELVVEALVRQRAAQSRHALQNSSLQAIPKALNDCLKVASKKVEEPEVIMKSTSKTFDETQAKIGIFLHGLRKYQEALSKVSDRESRTPPTESSPHEGSFPNTATEEGSKDLNITPASDPIQHDPKEVNTKIQDTNEQSDLTFSQRGTSEQTISSFRSVVLEQDAKNAFASGAREPVKLTSTREIRQSAKEVKQSLSSASRQRKVPASRISRLISFGSLGVGLGMGTLAEVTRRAIGIKHTDSSGAVLDSNPLLTDANATRIVDTLCKVRGAALKLGQMLSLQDISMINPKLQSIFERVRQSADFMPKWQMQRVLTEDLGPTWKSDFSSFEDHPFAAASIGQVHRGTLLNGTEVAVKVQYPGVAKGIDSDIDNLLALLDVWNILPKGLFIGNLATVMRKELKWEVDYKREAECARKFRKMVEPYPQYYVPEIINNLSSERVLTAELIYGTPVDKMMDADQSLRNWVSEQILRLALLEVFHFNFMQTDPNWSNFFYNETRNQLNLLDFGACREYSKHFVDRYLLVIKAAIVGDHPAVLRHSTDLGFMTGYESKMMEDAHVEAAMALGEPFRNPGPFDFSHQETTRRLHTLVPVMVQHRLTPPPEESYSLHRKLSGVFLLCTRLKANIDCHTIFQQILKDYRFQSDLGADTNI